MLINKKNLIYLELLAIFAVLIHAFVLSQNLSVILKPLEI